MSYRKRSDGYMVPATPASSGSSSRYMPAAPSDATESTTGSSGRSLVEHARYRQKHLRENNIYMHPPYEPYPEHVADTIRHIQRDRNSPGPSVEDIRRDKNLYNVFQATSEAEVEDYYRGRIYPTPDADDFLKRHDRQPMAKHAVPKDESANFNISTPIPAIKYQGGILFVPGFPTGIHRQEQERHNTIRPPNG